MIDYLILLPCALVVGCCICRVNLMRWPGHRPGWLLVYLGMAYVAGDVGFETLVRYEASGHDWVALMTFALYFSLTRDRWHAGPPPETKP